MKLKQAKGYLSDDWSFAAARDKNKKAKWVDVSKYPRGNKHIIEAKNVNWSDNFNTF